VQRVRQAPERQGEGAAAVAPGQAPRWTLTEQSSSHQGEVTTVPGTSAPGGNGAQPVPPLHGAHGRFVPGHIKLGGRRRGVKTRKQQALVEQQQAAQAPRLDPARARYAAETDMTRLDALARVLDGLIDQGKPTVPMLRLRMDMARTLSLLRDRLRRLPEPEPAAEDWLATLQEQPEPEPVPDAIAF